VLEKCANPKCSAVFRNLGDGKLFRVPRVGTISDSSGVVKKSVTMEHFWLCTKCAETMTLGIDRHRKVKVIPLRSARGAAAS
jgi:hypothetical protein